MKLFAEADVCLKITVEEDRCTVAEMDFISLAIMYRYGGAECGRKNIPVNPKDSVLPAGLYSVTVLPASRYRIFFTRSSLYGEILRPAVSWCTPKHKPFPVRRKVKQLASKNPRRFVFGSGFFLNP